LKWNEEAAPNNNLSSKTLSTSKFVADKQNTGREFAEELADGGERNEAIERQQKNK
jgi:hypothetical protein